MLGLRRQNRPVTRAGKGPFRTLSNARWHKACIGWSFVLPRRVDSSPWWERPLQLHHEAALIKFNRAFSSQAGSSLEPLPSALGL